jgi:hypothetical protein
LFKVKSSNKNDTRFEKSYRVRKQTNNEALIEKFNLATSNVAYVTKYTIAEYFSILSPEHTILCI